MSSLSILSRFPDIVEALQDPTLAPQTPSGATHSDFRRTAFEFLTPGKLAEWRSAIERICRAPECVDSIDLVTEVAQPWCLQIAALVADVPTLKAADLSGLAKAIFESAAEPFDASLEEKASAAATNLAMSLPEPIRLQAFVALSQTLPSFLANAWLALLEHPDQMAAFSSQPSAMEELLRYAGPSAAILRYGAAGPVALRLADANRDPAHFVAADKLDLGRNPKHLAFGFGEHSCVGASLIRMAATVATKAFLKHFVSARILEYVVDDRFAIRSLQRLSVSCSR